MKTQRIYIAGPMTGLPGLNFPAFHAAAAELRAQGHTVINPAEINPAEINPDITMAWHECMRKDISALVTCDAIHFLPGWECSRGATLEHHIADRLGLEVTYAPVPLSEYQRLRGEADVLCKLLTECRGVMALIDPESDDEAEALADLDDKVAKAIGMQATLTDWAAA